MRRFLVEGITTSDSEVEITGDEFRHLKKVLRLGPGSPAAVFDGRGLELAGVLTRVGADSATLAVESAVEGRGESPLELTLVLGLVKGGKPEFVIQKATELGVTGLVFYGAERSVPDLAGAKLARRLERWTRVAASAAKQCSRTRVPEVAFHPDIKSAVSVLPDVGIRVVLSGEGGSLLDIKLKDPAGAALLVGPEGGFTEEELGFARSRGFMPVRLGPRTLRAETASVAGAALVQHLAGDLGGGKKAR